MSFNIISIGDAEMLYRAFNGVAMIFNGNIMDKLIASGFILGTIITATSYVTTFQLSLNSMLAGIVMYMTLFIPHDAVTIEDAYTGQVYVVSNIPIGVAAPLSIVSQMGVTMTTYFETAFSLPGQAQLLANGYLNSLNVLLQLRKIGTNGTARSDQSGLGDLGATLNEYVDTCVGFDLEQTIAPPEVTREKINKADDLWAALATTLINMDINVNLPGATSSSQKNCNDAYVAISDYFKTDAGAAFLDNQVAATMGIANGEDTAANQIGNAASALSLNGINAQTWMQNALLASYLRDGPVAYIKRPAIENMNLQWASEQSMFNQIERPLLAFIEMFTVAISPIVAFLVVLGAAGIGMITRYIQLMLWISLWGPLLAVCNLYITVVVTRLMKALASQAEANGGTIQAMAIHDDFYVNLETWLSAGGMLASSVPALSLMIVYGGAVAATNLSSRMTSAASSSANVGSMAPPPLTVDSPMKVDSKGNFNANTAGTKTGMASTMISTAQDMSSAVSSKREAASSAGKNFTQATANMNQISSKTGTSTAVGKKVAESVGSQVSAANSTSVGSGGSTSTMSSLSDKESASIQNTAGAAAKAGTPARMIGAAVSLGLQASAGTSKERADILGNMAQATYGSQSTAQDVQSASFQSEQSEQTMSTSEKAKMQATSEAFNSALTTGIAASEAYTQAASEQTSMGAGYTGSFQQVASKLASSQSSIRALNLADQEMLSSMGSADYADLKGQSAKAINASSAILSGQQSDALNKFLTLRAHDPAAAAQILNDAVMPPNSNGGGSGVSFGAHEFQGGKGIGDIVSPEQTANMEARSRFNGSGGHGIEHEVDGDGSPGSPGSHGSHGSSKKIGSTGNHNSGYEHGGSSKGNHPSGSNSGGATKSSTNVSGGGTGNLTFESVQASAKAIKDQSENAKAYASANPLKTGVDGLDTSNTYEHGKIAAGNLAKGGADVAVGIGNDVLSAGQKFTDGAKQVLHAGAVTGNTGVAVVQDAITHLVTGDNPAPAHRSVSNTDVPVIEKPDSNSNK